MRNKQRTKACNTHHTVKLWSLAISGNLGSQNQPVECGAGLCFSPYIHRGMFGLSPEAFEGRRRMRGRHNKLTGASTHQKQTKSSRPTQTMFNIHKEVTVKARSPDTWTWSYVLQEVYEGNKCNHRYQKCAPECCPGFRLTVSNRPTSNWMQLWLGVLDALFPGTLIWTKLTQITLIWKTYILTEFNGH